MVKFDFSDSYTVGASYSDSHGNTITHNNDKHTLKTNGSLTNDSSPMQLYMIPNDWSSFTGLGNNFKMHFRINIGTQNVNDKFKSEFVHPSAGNQLEKGFEVHLFQNTLSFKGYVRKEDGNTKELLFNTYILNVQHITSFYGTAHDWDFEFSTFAIGNDSNEVDAWGLARILIDGNEEKAEYVKNVTDYTPQTQQDGVFLYTDNNNDNGYYKIFLAMQNTELYEFEMGRLR